MEGTPFGRYQLLDLLGRGGMGEVWRAFDTGTNRIVAIKVLSSHLNDDAAFEQRFRREARASAALEEPHIVPIHGYGEIDGRLYVDMRLVEGRDLGMIVADHPIDAARAVYVIEQIAAALSAAHDVGLVHRDVKPSNILIGNNDFAYLIDFGIARASRDTRLTGTDVMVGTWAYMAPERFTSDDVDQRSDIYALTCVLHECLTGRQPYPGSSIEQQVAAHLTATPPRPSVNCPGLPAAFDEVIAKGMAKDPDDRYSTIGELAHAARSAIPTPSTLPPHLLESTAAASRSHAESSSDPTQHRIFTDPTQQAPAQPDPHPPTPKSSRTRVIALSSLGAIAVVLAIVSAVVLSSSGDRRAAPSPSSTATTPTAVANTGPFTGTFNIAFGPPLAADGTPLAGKASADTFNLRSACGTNGCVATASTGGQDVAKYVVFDEIDGQWVSVSTSRRVCGNALDVEGWTVISLQRQPNEIFTGELTEASVIGCFDKRTVALSRTGDTDINSLADPAAEPPRVISPAEAFHGTYHSVYRPANGVPPVESDDTVRTDCLRAGDRCLSYFPNRNATNLPLIYANGAWTQETEADTTCTDGTPAHVKSTGTYLPPEPPQNPIALLAGHGYVDVIKTSGACSGTAYEQKFTRTGD